MRSSRVVVLAIALALAVVGVALWSRPSPPAPLSASRTFTLVVQANPSSWDPTRLVQVIDRFFVNAIHCPLALLRADGKLEMLLAKEIVMADDARSCVIRLRDAKFADGSPVDASAVARSFHRLFASGHPQAALIFARVSGLTKDQATGFEVIDAHTLKVHFNEPDPDWPYLIANPVCSVTGPSDKPEAEFGSQIVGAGPYAIIEKIEPGVRFVFKRNPGYPIHTGFDRMEIRVIDSEQAQLSAIADGSADIVQVHGPALSEVVTREPDGALSMRSRFANARIKSVPANELVFCFISQSDPVIAGLTPNQRANLQSVIYHALSRDAMVTNLYLGQARPAYAVVPSDRTDWPQPPKGVATDLPSIHMLAANDADSRRTAEIVRAAVEKAGLKVELSFVDLSTLAQRLLKGDGVQIGLLWIEMNLGSGASQLLPWMYLFWDQKSGFVVLGEKLDGVDEQIEHARGLTVTAERAAAYEKIVNQVQERQRVWVPIISRDTNILCSKSIAGDFFDVNGQLQIPFIRPSGGQ